MSPRVPSQLPLVGAVFLATMLLLGCGSSANEEEAVAGTIFAYIEAVVRGEGRLACDWLTRPQQRAVLQGATTKFPGLHARSCADAFSKFAKRLGPDVVVPLLSAGVRDFQIDDGKATAELAGGTTTIRLIHSSGRWLISGGLNLWTARNRSTPAPAKRTTHVS